jgi:hypothetical protein
VFPADARRENSLNKISAGKQTAVLMGLRFFVCPRVPENRWQRVRGSNPLQRLRKIAPFALKSARISALTSAAVEGISPKKTGTEVSRSVKRLRESESRLYRAT